MRSKTVVPHSRHSLKLLSSEVLLSPPWLVRFSLPESLTSHILALFPFELVEYSQLLLQDAAAVTSEVPILSPFG